MTSFPELIKMWLESEFGVRPAKKKKLVAPKPSDFDDFKKYMKASEEFFKVSKQ